MLAGGMHITAAPGRTEHALTTDAYKQRQGLITRPCEPIFGEATQSRLAALDCFVGYASSQ
jgi:hypothetical protein